MCVKDLESKMEGGGALIFLEVHRNPYIFTINLYLTW